jgi:hypothetical protein
MMSHVVRQGLGLPKCRPVLQQYRRALQASEAWLVVKADRRDPSVSEVSGPYC